MRLLNWDMLGATPVVHILLTGVLVECAPSELGYAGGHPCASLPRPHTDPRRAAPSMHELTQSCGRIMFHPMLPTTFISREMHERGCVLQCRWCGRA